VVEYGGVIKAAERLHLSQPTLSAGLKALEDELGGALFDRSGPANRPLRLSPAGQRFYLRAQEILNQCETARTEFKGESVSGHSLRLGVLDTLPQVRVADTIAQLAAQLPNSRIEVWEGTASRLAGWFAQERIDILWGNVADSSLRTRVLWREPLMAVVASGHEFAQTAGPISIRDLAKTPFVHRANCELDALGRAQLKAAKVKLDVRLRVVREELAFQWIREGKGITLAPRSLVPADLVTLSVTALDVQRSIGLQWQESLPIAVVSTVTTAIESTSGSHQAASP